jgi:hypothetical protein
MLIISTRLIQKYSPIRLKRQKVAGTDGSPPTNYQASCFGTHGLSDKDVKVIPFRNMVSAQLVKEGWLMRMTTTSYPAISIDEITASKPSILFR